jgi:hypothetical protein
MRELLVMALIGAMLLLGCSGSGPAPQSAPPQPPAAVQNQAPPSQPAQPAATSANESGPQAAPSALSDFMSLVGMKATGQWKVDYQLQTNSTGSNMTLPMTRYVEGADRLRTDLTVSRSSIRTYAVSGSYYFCIMMSGASSWTCYQLSEPVEDNITMAMSNIESNLPNYTIVADGTMQAAGATATCFSITGLPNSDEARECFSQEGVPLYFKLTTTGANAMQLEATATSYSMGVSDSDFELPAQPTQSNGTGGGSLCSYCSYLKGNQQSRCLAACGSAG